jgi:hypothetical protein
MRHLEIWQARVLEGRGRFAAVLLVLLWMVGSIAAMGQNNQGAAPAPGTRRPAAPAAKQKAAKPQAEPDWLDDAMKDPGFISGMEHVIQRIGEIPPPAPRTQSHILPRLSDTTAFYAAGPNYGQTLRQTVEIAQQELRDNAGLRDFVQKHTHDDQMKFQSALLMLADFCDYLGDEFVVAGSLKGKDPTGALIAEVRKPGLRAFLEQVDPAWNTLTEQHLRIFDPQQLETAADEKEQGALLLVRPDFVVIGFSVATLRDFNAQLDKGPDTFAAGALGKRLAQSYQSGAQMLMAMDLQKVLELAPQSPPQARMILDKTGFSDVKYFFGESKTAGKESVNQGELAFNGPRRGVASWIVAPGPLGSLDFLSPKAYTATVVRLKSFTQIFDDIAEMAGPDALATLPQLEGQFNVNLKQDILSKLSGEVAVEIENLPVATGDAGGKTTVAPPNIKLVMGVSDAATLEHTLQRVLANTPMESSKHVEDGVTIHSLNTPSGTEVNYFFLDDYLVIASTRALASETVQLHRGGGSLARSNPGVKASMLSYQNSGPFLAAMLKQSSPGVVAVLSKLLGGAEASPTPVYGYADETSLRGMTKNSMAANSTLGLMVAAVAIPNLMRSNTGANESAAASTVRTVNTSEVTYSTVYPDKGYAPSLAAMGPPPGSDCTNNNDATAAHACLLDAVLGNAGCTSGKWCTKGGYRYSVRGICVQANCKHYVVTATPLNKDTAAKSFCSVDDAVVRTRTGAPLEIPLTVAECRTWKPLM